METYLQVSSQGIHDLLRPNIVVDKDVLAVSDRIQGLLQPHALAGGSLLECIRVTLSGTSLNGDASLGVEGSADEFRGQGRDLSCVKDLLDRLRGRV